MARMTNHESRITNRTRRRALALLVVSAVLPGALAGCGFRPSGPPTLPFQTLDQAVLAKDNEQALLFQAMREDAVRQIMRRLSLARAPEPAA